MQQQGLDSNQLTQLFIGNWCCPMPAIALELQLVQETFENGLLLIRMDLEDFLPGRWLLRPKETKYQELFKVKIKLYGKISILFCPRL